MNLFEITNEVNQNKKLNFAQKALLNQIIGYNLNNKSFFATNQFLAEYWGCDIATIKRSIAILKTLGFITVSVDRKKHTTGDATWYNKRYIIPNYEVITGQEIVQDQPEILILESVETIQPVQEVTIDVDEPTLGVFPEQDNEYTRMFAQETNLPTSNAISEYSHEAMLEFINQNELYHQTMLSKFPETKKPDPQYTSGVFIYVLQKDESNMEKYRAITSRLKLVENDKRSA